MSSGKPFESYPKNISREIEHLLFLEGITKQSAGAVAPSILMFKKEILKGATSKHAKHMHFRNESGI